MFQEGEGKVTALKKRKIEGDFTVEDMLKLGLLNDPSLTGKGTEIHICIERSLKEHGCVWKRTKGR